MSGAGTSPNSHVFAYAAASVKKMLEVVKELGGVKFFFDKILFWLNTIIDLICIQNTNFLEISVNKINTFEN